MWGHGGVRWLRVAAAVVFAVAMALVYLILTGDCEPEGVCEPLFGAIAFLIFVAGSIVALLLVALSLIVGRISAKDRD